MGLAMADGGEWQVVDRRAKGPERSGGSQAHKATRKSTALSPKEQYGARDPPRVRASSALLSITSRGCAPLGGDANKLCVSPRVACRSHRFPLCAAHASHVWLAQGRGTRPSMPYCGARYLSGALDRSASGISQRSSPSTVKSRLSKCSEEGTSSRGGFRSSFLRGPKPWTSWSRRDSLR